MKTNEAERERAPGEILSSYKKFEKIRVQLQNGVEFDAFVADVLPGKLLIRAGEYGLFTLRPSADSASNHIKGG